MQINGQLQVSAASTLRKSSPDAHCIESCLRPRAGLTALEKRNVLLPFLGVGSPHLDLSVRSLVIIPPRLFQVRPCPNIVGICRMQSKGWNVRRFYEGDNEEKPLWDLTTSHTPSYKNKVSSVLN